MLGIERLFRLEGLLDRPRLGHAQERALQIHAAGELLGMCVVGGGQVGAGHAVARLVPDVGLRQLHGARGRGLGLVALCPVEPGPRSDAGRSRPGARAGPWHRSGEAGSRGPPRRQRPPPPRRPRSSCGGGSPWRSAGARGLPRPSDPSRGAGRAPPGAPGPSGNRGARRPRRPGWRCATPRGCRSGARRWRRARAPGSGRRAHRGRGSPGIPPPCSRGPGGLSGSRAGSRSRRAGRRAASPPACARLRSAARPVGDWPPRCAPRAGPRRSRSGGPGRPPLRPPPPADAGARTWLSGRRRCPGVPAPAGRRGDASGPPRAPGPRCSGGRGPSAGT